MKIDLNNKTTLSIISFVFFVLSASTMDYANIISKNNILGLLFTIISILLIIKYYKNK